MSKLLRSLCWLRGHRYEWHLGGGGDALMCKLCRHLKYRRIYMYGDGPDIFGHY